METLLTNPVITPDEVNSLQMASLATGIDSVSTNFGFRATQPSSWAPVHWKKAVR
jgi:hypothetical protein